MAVIGERSRLHKTRREEEKKKRRRSRRSSNFYVYVKSVHTICNSGIIYTLQADIQEKYSYCKPYGHI